MSSTSAKAKKIYNICFRPVVCDHVQQASLCVFADQISLQPTY